MKIGLVSYHSFFKPGGVQNHILFLAKEFKKRGISVKIIIPRRDKSERYSEDIIFLGKSIPINFKGTEGDFSFATNLRKISKVLEEENFDILHFHNFGILSYQILKKSKSLNILTVHTGYKKKEIFKENIILGLYFKGKKRILKSISFLTNGYFSLKRFVGETKKRLDGIIAVSLPAFNLLEEYNGPKKIIPNGIDLALFSFRGKKITEFKDDNFFNILFLGRIEERKGLIFLLMAYEILQKKYNNLRLIIIGEGNKKKECQEFVKKKNLRNVYFLGEVSNHQTPSYYRTANLFVSPAIYGESFGIVLLEAMACGTPVVAFDNEGYRQVMEGKYKYFLAKPRDFLGLARKMELLIKDQKKQKEMREFGLKLVQKYSWPKIAEKILGFYQECQKEKFKKRNFLTNFLNSCSFRSIF